MYCLKKQIIPLLLFVGSLFGQFRENVPRMELPSNINGDLDDNRGFTSFLDPYRFDIKHGFSMSMASAGGHPISTMAYNTNISYLITENMAINTNIILMNSSRGQIANKNMGYQNLKFRYDASFVFKPSENSFIKLELKSLDGPLYQDIRNRPFYSNFSIPN
tara:strand:+ start:29886 stop:30371 length:486 start_codon:yes stop_codon:yes gene_type:complete